MGEEEEEEGKQPSSDVEAPAPQSMARPSAAELAVELAVTSTVTVVADAEDLKKATSDDTANPSHSDGNEVSRATAAAAAAAPAPASERPPSPLAEALASDTVFPMLERISQSIQQISGSFSNRLSFAQPSDQTASMASTAPRVAPSAPLATLSELDDSDGLGGQRSGRVGVAGSGGGSHDPPLPAAPPHVGPPGNAGSLKAIPLHEADFNERGSLIMDGEADDDKVFLVPVVVKRVDRDALQA